FVPRVLVEEQKRKRLDRTRQFVIRECVQFDASGKQVVGDFIESESEARFGFVEQAFTQKLKTDALLLLQGPKVFIASDVVPSRCLSQNRDVIDEAANELQ